MRSHIAHHMVSFQRILVEKAVALGILVLLTECTPATDHRDDSLKACR